MLQSDEQHQPSSARLDKRAAVTYTAYYGWKNGASVQSLPTDEGTISALAEQLYNYGKNKNKSQFCADLQGGVNSAGLTRQLTAGNYALITGIFDDRKGKC